MSLQLVFHPSVRLDIQTAYSWLEQQRFGLGTEFLDEVEQVYAELMTNPARYGFGFDDVREGQLIRFPYTVYYRVLSNSIRILGV